MAVKPFPRSLKRILDGILLKTTVGPDPTTTRRGRVDHLWGRVSENHKPMRLPDYVWLNLLQKVPCLTRPVSVMSLKINRQSLFLTLG